VTTLTEEQKAEIRARADAATPGPWRQEGPRVYFGFEGGIGLRAAPNPISNSHFIAHARTDIPALLSALEAAQSANRPRDDYPVFCSDCGRAHVLDTGCHPKSGTRLRLQMTFFALCVSTHG
jgi:hypothetical protein